MNFIVELIRFIFAATIRLSLFGVLCILMMGIFGKLDAIPFI
jgi:hypothetical protein